MTTQGGDTAAGPDIPDPGDTDHPQVWSPDPYPALTGLCIIASIYLLPVFPAPAPGAGLLTLAGAIGDAPGGPYLPGPMLLLTFWLGWGAATGLIIHGLISQRPDRSFKKT